MLTATNKMHIVFANAAANMHYNDELLSAMLEAHKQLAEGNDVGVLDNLLDTLNAEFDANEKDGMMQGRDTAKIALEMLEDEDTHAGMQMLWIACMQRMFACEQVYG